MSNANAVERKNASLSPPRGKPLLLLSVSYSGAERKAYLKLYDPETGKIYHWYDTTGHKPYCLTDLMPEEIVEHYPQVLSHKGFDHLEVVEKFDPLHDEYKLMTKVVARDPLSIGGARGAIRDILPRTWESKIKYHLCYIYDQGLIPGMFYKVENGEVKPVPIKLSEQLIKLAEKLYGYDEQLLREAKEWLKLFQAPIPDIRRVAMDIEVFSPYVGRIPNPKEAKYKVIAVAFSANDGFNRVLVLRRKNVKWEEVRKLDNGVEVEYFDDEEELLRRTFEIIRAYPVVLTFNGDNFDLNYLYHRALKLGFRPEEIPIQLGREAAYISPGIHIDLYKFFDNHAMQVYAFKNKYREAKTLDSIAQALLGVGKIKFEGSISDMPYRVLAAYCFRDAEITLKLTTFENNLVMKLIILLMRISKLPIEDITRSGISSWIKNMMYFEHRRRGWLIPEPEDIRKVKGDIATKAIIKGKKYLGAFVIDPLPGIFMNVIVVDFASLYPSVVKRWNLSYETINCPHEECKRNKVPGLPHHVCIKRRGLSSVIIGFLRDFRVEIYKPLSKRKDLPYEERETYEVVQRALKVFINASYGVFGAETFPLYCPPVAESTTALGRYAISKTIVKAHQLGLIVLYGDTDSLFLWNPPQDKLKELIAWSQKELGIDLDIDKEYVYVALSGKKKNYLGLLKEGKIDIKGLVGKKRHTPEFIKQLFKDITEALAEVKSIDDVEKVKEKIREITRASIKKLKSRQYSLDQLAFHVALTKNPHEYTKNTPQHVKAARLLERYGIKLEAGDIVSFVKTKGALGVKPVQLARIDEIDEDKYLSHIETACRQVLEAIGVDFDELLGKAPLMQFK